jgi:FlaA1/EpsC-like NDP-sugar epimerase
LFTASDTTGEKDFEEFFTDQETLDMQRFANLGVIKNQPIYDADKLQHFEKTIAQMKTSKQWNKQQIVELFHQMIPDFGHKETGKYLDGKM